MTIVVIVVAAWLFVLALVFALLTMAKRADEQIARAAGSPWEAVPGARALARFAVDVQRLLSVERVVVIVADVGDDGVGEIVACAGATGLAGAFVPIGRPQQPRISTSAKELALLGLGPEAPARGWAVAYTPMVRPDGTTGVLAVGSRLRPFTGSELAALGDMAIAASSRFQRQRLHRRVSA